MLNTPILDQFARRPEYWDGVKTRIQQAETNKKIYNQDFEDCKSSLNSCAERAVDDAWKKIRELPDWDQIRSAMTNLTMFWTTTSANKMVRDLHKEWDNFVNQPDNVVQDPAFAEGVQNMNNRRKALKHYIAVWDEAAAALKELLALKPYIIKGRKPAENQKPVDVSHTGTCTICRRQQKLGAGDIVVHHGFEISDKAGHYFGERLGKCYGTGYQPYELSCNGNKAFKKGLEDTLARHKANLAELQTGKMILTKITRKRNGPGNYEDVKTILRPGKEGYDEYLRQCIDTAQRDIEHITRDIEDQGNLIKNWVAKPLAYGSHPKTKGGSVIQFPKR